jgi:hypothetical protein
MIKANKVKRSEQRKSVIATIPTAISTHGFIIAAITKLLIKANTARPNLMSAGRNTRYFSCHSIKKSLMYHQT